ncbi:MAG TPA: class A beta-lactamase [Thermoanaerobaculia bacterium]
MTLGTFLLAVVTACSLPNLREQLGILAAPAKGPVGAAMLLVESNEKVSLDGDRRFPMQSVYKLPIAMAVLHRVDENRLALDRVLRVEREDLAPGRSPIREKYPEAGVTLTVEELLRAMIEEGDNTACDVLLEVVSAADVTADLRRLGIRDMTIAASEKEMGRDIRIQYENFSTPEAAVELLRVLHRGDALAAGSRRRLLEWMTQTPLAPARIKGLLPAGTPVAHRTGLSGTVDGVTAATNDIGVITLPDGRHLAIAVFVSDSPADEATREKVIAKIARAAWDCWAPASQ